MTQLAAYIKQHGPDLHTSDGKTFTVEGISGEGELAVATFRKSETCYTGVVAVRKDLVRGKPGAELWTIVGSRRAIAKFAIWQDTLITLK